jgi:nucleotide-binding universal stress UspA family protein
MDRSIFVGIDGAATGRAAVRWAMTRAGRLGLRVILVHVVDDEWGGFGERSLPEIHPEIGELVAAELVFAHSVEPKVAVETTVLIGDPMVELAAASRDAEMVVVGTHKTGFLHGRAFGSRSIQLAAMSWCPIAVIPEYVSDTRHSVMFGLAGTAASDAALRFAVQEAMSLEQELVIIHATEDSMPASGQSRVDAQDMLIVAEAQATETARTLGLTGQVRIWRIGITASRALVDAGSTGQLLVIGSTRRRGRELSTLGPVCHDVLMNISSPTIVVHSDSVEPASTPIEEESRTR